MEEATTLPRQEVAAHLDLIRRTLVQAIASASCVAVGDPGACDAGASGAGSESLVLALEGDFPLLGPLGDASGPATVVFALTPENETLVDTAGGWRLAAGSPPPGGLAVADLTATVAGSLRSVDLGPIAVQGVPWQWSCVRLRGGPSLPGLVVDLYGFRSIGSAVVVGEVKEWVPLLDDLDASPNC